MKVTLGLLLLALCLSSPVGAQEAYRDSEEYYYNQTVTTTCGAMVLNDEPWYVGRQSCGVSGQTTFTAYTTIKVQWGRYDSKGTFFATNPIEQHNVGGEGFPCSAGTVLFDAELGTNTAAGYKYVRMFGGWFNSGNSGSITKYQPIKESRGCYFAPLNSPILLSRRGSQSFELSSAANGTLLDFLGDGSLRRVAWTQPGTTDEWLARDRNGNGTIDSAAELYGNATPQRPAQNPNGYRALADEDTNGDNVVGPGDAQWEDGLLLWNDADANGVSEPHELTKVSRSGILYLRYDYTFSGRRDGNGNLFPWCASMKYTNSQGAVATGRTCDVLLTSGQ